LKDYILELVGTFTLVFAITAASVGLLAFTGDSLAVNVIGTALTAGLVLATLMYAFGSQTGGHFNPALTLGLYFAKKFPQEKLMPFMAAQMVGGIAASFVLWQMVLGGDLGATFIGSFGQNAALGVETVATAVLMIIFLAVHKNAGKGGSQHAPLAVGFFFLAAYIFAIPFSGGSLNPARSLGPALFVGGAALQQLWIYFVGPIVGAIIGALIYNNWLD